MGPSGQQAQQTQQTQMRLPVGQLAAVNAMNSQPVNQPTPEQAFSGAPYQGVPASTPTPVNPASSSPTTLAQMYQRMQQAQMPQGRGIISNLMGMPVGTNAQGGPQSLGQSLGGLVAGLFS
jgi:hypothetical protein